MFLYKAQSSRTMIHKKFLYILNIFLFLQKDNESHTKDENQVTGFITWTEDLGSSTDWIPDPH